MLSSAASTTASIMSYKSSSSPLFSLSTFQKHLLLLLCCVCKNMVSDRWEDCVKSSFACTELSIAKLIVRFP